MKLNATNAHLHMKNSLKTTIYNLERKSQFWLFHQSFETSETILYLHQNANHTLCCWLRFRKCRKTCLKKLSRISISPFELINLHRKHFDLLGIKKISTAFYNQIASSFSTFSWTENVKVHSIIIAWKNAWNLHSHPLLQTSLSLLWFSLFNIS